MSGHRDLVNFPFNPGPPTILHPHRPPGRKTGRESKYDYVTRLDKHREARRRKNRIAKAARRRNRGVQGYRRIGSQRRV